VARPKALDMMDLACQVLYADTEEAVILALNICFNLCRVFRNPLEPKLPALMEFIKQVFPPPPPLFPLLATFSWACYHKSCRPSSAYSISVMDVTMDFWLIKSGEFLLL